MSAALAHVSLCLLLLSAAASAGRAASGQRPDHGAFAVVPRPEYLVPRSGSFEILPSTRIVAAGVPRMPFPPEYFAARMRSVTGFPLSAHIGLHSGKGAFIKFLYVPADTLGTEGYSLDVTRAGVTIQAGSDAGHFYAVQTLFQLLPPAVFSARKAEAVRWKIPCVSIRDRPRFGWRGVHLDVSRHFFPPAFIRTLVDLLALHKLNVFHWHLTDDQGWRIEIRRYPRLTEIGAWRADREGVEWNLREPQQEGEPASYGGFYTQQEIREIVRYAQERNVTILPEIEMPAHTTAALAAYPQYSCTGGPFHVTTGALWPITDIFCAGNDSTFVFLENVLTEVFDLFPGTYVHIGGDEADKTNWRTCPKCQARIRQEGLADENELQSWFIGRMERFVRARGRRLIGWDEILDGGLAPGAAVMSWRGVDGGLEAARLGHDVVMTPGSNCYFNSYQGRPEFEPPAGGGYLPLRKVYAFDPVPDTLTTVQAAHILGGEACLWTEYVADSSHAEYMLLPRLAAMAEVLWTLKERRSESDFFRRIEPQLDRYRAGGYTFAKSLYLVSMLSTLDTARRRVLVTLAGESANTAIRYTLDGSAPTVRSPVYRGPFSAERSLYIRAVSVGGGRLLGPPTMHRVVIHRAIARPVTVQCPYGKYTGGGPFALTDGVLGTTSYDDGRWQGYEQADLDATVDLGTVVPVSNLTTHFLQDHRSWIFGPRFVRYEISEDGRTFTEAGRREFTAPAAAQEASIIEVSQPVAAMRARFIRVYAGNLGVCPAWHPGHGGKAWLFVDEIIVE